MLKDERLNSLLRAIHDRLLEERLAFEARHLASLSAATARIVAALPTHPGPHRALKEEAMGLLGQAVQAGLDLGSGLGAREAASMAWAVAKSGQPSPRLMLDLSDAMWERNPAMASLSVFSSGWGTHLALCRQSAAVGASAGEGGEAGVEVLEGLTPQLFGRVASRVRDQDGETLEPRVIVNLVRPVLFQAPFYVSSDASDSPRTIRSWAWHGLDITTTRS